MFYTYPFKVGGIEVFYTYPFKVGGIEVSYTYPFKVGWNRGVLYTPI